MHPRIGPRSLPRDRSDYSLSLSDSWKEQTLLNIVKFRYIDPPVFVDVGSIVSSYRLSQSASVAGSFQPGGPNTATIGGSLVAGVTIITTTITMTTATGAGTITAGFARTTERQNWPPTGGTARRSGPRSVTGSRYRRHLILVSGQAPTTDQRQALR